jgi:preprotein translocase subunit SecA
MYSEVLDRKAIYSQRYVKERPLLDRLLFVQRKRLGYHTLAGSSRCQQLLVLAAAAENELASLSDSQVCAAARALQTELRRDLLAENFASEAIARCLACVRIAAQRRVNQRHYDVQLLGALLMLQGNIVEMETGEGKSLTAVAVAVVAALAGFPVHVITVNDYLAERDAQEFADIYALFDLSVGVIKSGLPPEERAEIYREDVVYCTNKELTFDYLKDRLKFAGIDSRKQLLVSQIAAANQVSQRPLLRGLYFAVIDEADSVLADEARTPLIISGEGAIGVEGEIYVEAIRQARTLEINADYLIDLEGRAIRWLPAGDARLPELAAQLGGIWSGPLRAKEMLTKALSALYLYENGREYVVVDDKVQIVDEYTGRIMEDRSWEGGLHQLIEVKEGVEMTPQRLTLAKTTYQRFFRRYWRVAGMTGTAREIAAELSAVYAVGTVRVPTNKPSQRISQGARVFADRDSKFNYIAERTRELNATGRPVLIGTRSVTDSEELAERFMALGISNKVLNAVQDQEEADIVACAGQTGQVTVATNMAGRGTDIKPCEAALAAGGLHVIATEPHDSLRVDRQLFGRSGRQGNPGSYQCVFSFADEMPRRFLPEWQQALGRRLAGSSGTAAQWLAYQIIRFSQYRAERANAAARRDLLKSDDRILSKIGFAKIRE